MDRVGIREFYTMNEWDDWYVVGVIPEGNNYYIGTDSGCSCYIPWEHYKDIYDFTGPLTYDQMCEEVTSLVISLPEVEQQDVDMFLRRLRG